MEFWSKSPNFVSLPTNKANESQKPALCFEMQRTFCIETTLYFSNTKERLQALWEGLSKLCSFYSTKLFSR